MSEQSEFEKWRAEHIKTWTTEALSKEDCIDIGMIAARDWFLAKAKELSWEEGLNRNLSLEDLEKACK